MKALAEQISDIDGINIYGRVVGVRGLMVEIAGPIHAMSVGARIVIDTGGNRFIPCEVIGFTGSNAVVMPFAGLEGVRRGCRAVIANSASQVRPSPLWLGRVLNAMGEPIDGKGPLPVGASPVPYRNSPPSAHSRKRVGAPLDLGVRALNTFLTCCRGQRLGIFAGSGIGLGTITGIFTVLVDGDDHNEPIADAVRGILDGHVVMERRIAERGRFPAINVLKSVSRTMPKSANPDYLGIITRARQVMSTYADMEELIRLGAYRAGSSAEVDEAIALHEPLEAFLRQGKDEATGLNEGYRQLERILGNLETER